MFWAGGVYKDSFVGSAFLPIHLALGSLEFLLNKHSTNSCLCTCFSTNFVHIYIFCQSGVYSVGVGLSFCGAVAAAPFQYILVYFFTFDKQLMFDLSAFEAIPSRLTFGLCMSTSFFHGKLS